MELIFVTEARFYKTKDGKIYAGEMSFNNNLWLRYLKKFTKVYVVARVFYSDQIFQEKALVDNVEFLPISEFDTVVSFAQKRQQIKRQLSKYLLNGTKSIIIRGAGSLGYLSAKICKNNKIPYAIEIIGDPYEVFAPGVTKHILRPILRKLFTSYQKIAVKHASAVLYVTKYALQEKYPVDKKAFVTYASDVFIDMSLKREPKRIKNKNSIELISIGSLEQMYKSPDILIKAISELNKKGIDAKLKWLGHGKFMDNMKQLSAELCIDDKVSFLGNVSAEDVRKYLEVSDIFVLVSRTEGLPRAMVEAMLMGLPSIGTKVGGIPELIQKDLLVSVNDVKGICDKVELLIENPDMYEKVSINNLEKVRDYSSEKLEERRDSFFDFISNMY
ncbi:glycosyltransferase family 4 protein [Elizabethkingia anophelis]|uniref:glycosyltransferase family 4 protein n=1 Tax=Elizabethkingia anophelis TaxID=1117645 RepID=UPI00301C2C7B